MNVIKAFVDLRRKTFSRLFISIFILITLLLFFKYHSYQNKAKLNKKLSNIINVSPQYFCKTETRLKFNHRLETADKYLYSRFDSPEIYPESVSFPQTPQNNLNSSEYSNRPKRKNRFFFAMNLYNNEENIPYITQELTLVLKHLGPENVFLSIYENNSDDKTKDLLNHFKVSLKTLGFRFLIITDDATRPEMYHRIEYLAGLRNKALAPLFEETSLGYKYHKIIFINDIIFCKNDILELIYQSDLQKSDITVPIDVFVTGKPEHLEFRDTWVARDLNGKPIAGGLDNLISHKASAKRYNQGLPFQVQCGWNGAAVLNAKPFLGHNPLRFRRSNIDTNECSASECSLLCNDFWKLGLRRIVIVPNILVGYKKEHIPFIDHYIQKFIKTSSSLPEKISYKDGPKKILCIGLDKNNTYHPDNKSKWIKYVHGNTKVV
ncbi:Alpha-1,3-mannosyltransferase CMT1 [Smittium culicis]|uniref:Alpha-1,3-mannosyltransferase CMT1 n=1 Tax=Smittium culicis TaxID=133412 RepID=A0A1R1YJM3_9FUNG|nr:Alpha-1,3-mannosyltransferase CMT1 [Smittium culicis]